MDSHHGDKSTIGRLKVSEIKSDIASLVMKGFALSCSEYHLAIAFGFLLSELSYHEFYTKKWHETKTHRTYRAIGRCGTCKEERKKMKCEAKS